MKKIIVIIAALVSLVIANMFINKSYVNNNEESSTLYEAIGIVSPNLIVIKKDDNELILKREDLSSDYGIPSIHFLADRQKTQSLQRFLNNKVKDVYENNTENLRRLGFNLKKKEHKITINNTKTLWIGNVNKYNEVYILQANKIYKVDYFQDLSDISTKNWVLKYDLLELKDTDEFDIRIGGSEDLCTIKHKDMVFHPELSIIRNSFIDLYFSDVFFLNEDSVMLHEMDNHVWRGLGSESYTLEYPEKKSFRFTITKAKDIVYFRYKDIPFLYRIPNAVADNLNNACEKYKSILKNQ
ncbi:MAG: hypothetical protein HN613_02595 [Gammaproteobacteria bacterium]|jgi:hypothetical protein|nr:hypothetical protein [Gammaproteobacteria bacterium]MBT7603484.1 hypothetical protein [Gammaproteobacteria bacterium]